MKCGELKAFEDGLRSLQQEGLVGHKGCPGVSRGRCSAWDLVRRVRCVRHSRFCDPVR